MKQQTVQSKKMSIPQKIGWAFLMLMATFPVLISLGYLTFDPDNFNFTDQKMVYAAHLTMLMMHIIGAMLAILIGPFQFLRRLRTGRFLKIHRWLGRIYLISVLISGIGGLYMAQFAYGGIVSELGFTALAVLWLYSAYRAYRHIRNKQIDQHREWMIRNYALTFAGVMLRLWVPTSLALGIDFLAAYRVIAWLCWVPNLFFAQWMINRIQRSLRRPTPSARRDTLRAAQTNLSYEGD